MLPPGRRGIGQHDFSDDLGDLIGELEGLCPRAERLYEFGMDRRAEQHRIGHGDRDPAVAGSEDAVWRLNQRVGAPGLPALGTLASIEVGDQFPALGLQHRAQHAHVDLLPLAGPVTLPQGEQDALDEEMRAEHVGDEHA